MKTTNLGNVAVTNFGHKRYAQPMNKNIYSSCGFGEIQPVQCQLLDPDTKNRFSTESLLYLASINAPTYGHVNLNFWHYFVSYSDLTSLYEKIFSQTAVEGNGVFRYADKFPYIQQNFLSLLPLMYSHCTVYRQTLDYNNEQMWESPWFQTNDSTSQAAVASFVQDFRDDCVAALTAKGLQTYWSDYGDPDGLGYNHLSIDFRLLIDYPECENITGNADPWFIPLSNPVYFNGATLSDALRTLVYMKSDSGEMYTTEHGIDIAPVTVNGADFLIERTLGSTTYLFAFRMHGFGKRIYKALKGSGFAFDFSSTEPSSLLPLFAVYKAYFDCFGLTLYSNWNSTPAAFLLKSYDDNGGLNPSFAGILNHSTNNYGIQLRKFFIDLGSMWYTDSQDFVSSHTNSPNVATSVPQTVVDSIGPHAGLSAQEQAVPSIVQPQSTVGIPVVDRNYQAYINRVLHNNLDSEVLKILALHTNADTIAGKRIKELLVQQGYGKWYDKMKPRFIGHTAIPVDFSQVISTANTYNNSSRDGAIVGERGGRGQAYGESKKFAYTNDEHGFLITLCAVVPDAGYMQTLNPAFTAIDKWTHYTPMFDGKGMELTPIHQVCGDMPVLVTDNGNKVVNATKAAFGWTPRESKWKVNQNTLSGDFARRSTRQKLLTYNMDKFIDLGEVVEDYTKDIDTQGVTWRNLSTKLIFPVSQFPRAGLAWRYPTRYPWLGHFDRIFAFNGDFSNRHFSAIDSIDVMFKSYEFINNESDGFHLLSTLKYIQNTPKRPITDTFGTLEDDDPSNSSALESKA